MTSLRSRIRLPRRPGRPLAAALVLLAGVSGGVQLSGANFTARSANGGSGVSSASDWTPPTVTMTDPGSPLRGTVTFAATASDPDSGVARVTVQRRSGETWTTICADESAPYSCAVDTTTIPDGSYDLRAVAEDRSGYSATSTVVAARVVDNGAPSVALADVASDLRGTVTLAARATDDGTGVASVRIERSLAGAGNWAAICTDASAPYECSLNTTALANDLYDLRAVATDAIGNTATSAVAEDVQVDNAAPTGVSISVPGTNPGNTIRGTVSLTAAATDADSGVRTVALQWSKAGAGAWTTICDTASPYQCAFDTTTAATPAGDYDFRAIATDRAGNATASSTVKARIDNATASVSVRDPGAFLRGTVTLTASAYSPAGVASVAIERAPSGGSTWTQICSDQTAPYECAFDTRTVTDGLYDLRARMTPVSGSAITSAVVSARRIDNSPVVGLDVQAINGGMRIGRVDAGDQVALTWSDRMKPETLIPGWTGTAAASLTARLRDAGTADTVELLDASGRATGMGLGSIALNGDYARKNRTIDMPATATYATVTAGAAERTVVTITLGAAGNGGVRTWSSATAMTWTPGATAQDALGRMTSAAPVTETGDLDRDF